MPDWQLGIIKAVYPSHTLTLFDSELYQIWLGRPPWEEKVFTGFTAPTSGSGAS